ncbi:MAG TPA: hypothetical protein VMC81_04835 [Rhodocyclaceae bacterium]|nr:hypothetical protein [Rhodocyclaceae bacterium]
MTKSLWAVLAICLLPSLAWAGEPIANPESLEGEITACLQKLTKTSHCTEDVLAPHIVPGSEQLRAVARQIDELLPKWLGQERIFAVHPIAARKTGDIFQARTYLLEDSSGSLMLFKYSVLKRLGQWYVFSFNMNSKSEEIVAVLKDRE